MTVKTAVTALRITLATLATMVLAAPAAAQEGPVPGSPRLLAIGHFDRLLAAEEKDLDKVITEVFAPATIERFGAESIRATVDGARKSLASDTRQGASPVSEFTVELMYQFPDGQGSVTFSLEPEAPHRLTELSLKKPGGRPDR